MALRGPQVVRCNRNLVNFPRQVSAQSGNFTTSWASEPWSDFAAILDHLGFVTGQLARLPTPAYVDVHTPGHCVVTVRGNENMVNPLDGSGSPRAALLTT